MRRFATAAAAALLCLGAAAAAPSFAAAADLNAVQAENALPGTPGWDGPGTGAVEGYAEPTVAAGDALHFHVSTRPVARYRVEIYRLGWYGGVGARRVACTPSCTGDRVGIAQAAPGPPPADAKAAPIRAGWSVTDTLTVGSDWTSGYYLARFVLTDGPEAGRAGSTYVIVREPAAAARPSQILVQVPVNTWQAYNQWGGKSLYDFGIDRMYRVSFERPYGKFAQSPFWWEIQLVRFLEREGYDVSYQTDIDTDRDPGSLLRHRLAMTAGHGEYWTKSMRDAFEAARDAGTNLAFMGSNTAYWQVQYEDGGSTIFAYKSMYDPNPDPTLKTAMFREVGRPECELMAVQHRFLRTHQAGPVDYTATDAAATDPWFKGTGLVPGSVVTDVVGDEWDALNPYTDACVKPGATVLFHHGESSPQGDADAVRYTAPSGARVFASGAQRFAWGLDTWGAQAFGHTAPADPGLQQFVRNALDDLTRPAPPTIVLAAARRGRVRVAFQQPPDERDVGVRVSRISASGAVVSLKSVGGRCVDRPGRGRFHYRAVTVDRWGAESAPVESAPVLSRPPRRGPV
jgi:hypothetical protein